MDKDEIIELAKISGCDLDGDVVLIGDKRRAQEGNHESQ